MKDREDSNDHLTTTSRRRRQTDVDRKVRLERPCGPRVTVRLTTDNQTVTGTRGASEMIRRGEGERKKREERNRNDKSESRVMDDKKHNTLTYFIVYS